LIAASHSARPTSVLVSSAHSARALAVPVLPAAHPAGATLLATLFHSGATLPASKSSAVGFLFLLTAELPLSWWLGRKFGCGQSDSRDDGECENNAAHF
jgi:apolipoprotein N-acyltransferase